MAGKKYIHIDGNNVDKVVINTSNGFKGTVTPSGHESDVDLGTTVSGIMKGDGSAASAAVADVDYVTPSKLPKLYKNGVLQTNPIIEHQVAGAVAGGSGVVTFNIADSGGSAIFTSLVKEGCNFWTNVQTAFTFDNWTLSTDKKTLSVRVSYPVLLSGLYATAANGTTVYLQAKGN